MAETNPTTLEPKVNRLNPATWLKPDQPLIGADGRDWSWAYIWFKDFPGYPGYKAGSDGSVWSRLSKSGGQTGQWKRLKPTVKRRSGYLCLSIRSPDDVRIAGGRRIIQFGVHQIILMTFVGPNPHGMQVCHFPDKNRANNRLENLMWGTSKQNNAHRRAHGTDPVGSRNPNAKLTEELADIAIRLCYAGVPRKTIAEAMRVTVSAIDGAVGGYHWNNTEAARNSCP